MADLTQARPVWRRPALAFGLIASVALLAVLLTQAAGPTAGEPTAPGSPLPVLDGLKAINGTDLQAFDLAAQGKGHYLIIFYWVAGHVISEDNLVAMNDYARAHDDVALVSVVPPRGKTPQQVAERAAALGIDVPIIWDEDYKMQATVRAGGVPHITVVDPSRVVRVAGAASPRHEVSQGTTLTQYMDRATAGGGAPTIAQVPRYYPVTELIGTSYTDFTLSQVPSRQALRFADQVTDGRLTLLVFWSPDCGHCKQELPQINTYYQAHRDTLNVVGIVKTKDASFRQRIADFIRLQDIQFPTVEDHSQDVWNRYKVSTTPTTIVVAPDGRVETVLLGSAVDLEKEIGARLARLREATQTGA